MKMRLSWTILAAVLLIAVMTGCPPNGPDQTPEPSDSLPVVVVAQSDTPNPVGAATGSLRVKFGLYDVEKGLGYEDQQMIGEKFKHEAENVSVTIQQNGPNWRSYWFDLPVVDGEVDGMAMAILPGDYEVWVYVRDGNYYVLFETIEAPVVSIVPGAVTQTSVTVEFKYSYPFCLSIDSLDLSGQNCWVKLVEDGTYREFWGYWFINQAGQTVFWLDLPLDFNGGTLVITEVITEGGWEIGGEILYQCQVPLDVSELDFGGEFHFGDLLAYDYVANAIYGEVEINIIFGYEDDHYVRLGDPNDGVEYQTVADCISQNQDGPLNIYLGEGDYEVSYMPYDRQICLTGLGADRTRLVNNDENQPSVIYMSPWARPNKEQVKSEAMKGATSGGLLGLYDLEVHNGPGKRNEYYSDAAVVVEGGITLTMINVVIASESNACVAANYATNVSIYHCDLVGPGFFGQPWSGSANGVAAYNEQQVYVFDSIIKGVNIAFYCTNGAVVANYNCVNDVGGLYFCESDPQWELATPGFVFADPQFGESWRLLPTSPCVGAGDDQLDIGVLFDEA